MLTSPTGFAKVLGTAVTGTEEIPASLASLFEVPIKISLFSAKIRQVPIRLLALPFLYL